MNTLNFSKSNLMLTIIKGIATFIAMLVFSSAAQAVNRTPIEGYPYAGIFYSDVKTAAAMGCKSFGPQSPGVNRVEPTEGAPRTFTVYCNIYPVYPTITEMVAVYFGKMMLSRACPDSAYTTDGAIVCSVADEKKPDCPCDGNPISLGTRAKIQTEKDYSTELGLEFTRYYSSLTSAYSPEGLTRNWRHSYSKRLNTTAVPQWLRPSPSAYQFVGNSWSPKNYPAPPGKDVARISDVDGYGIYFESDGAGGWVADPDVNARLVSAPPDQQGVINEWTLYKADDSVEVYDRLGLLVSERARSGRTRTLVYSVPPAPLPGEPPQPGVLMEVHDNFGAALHFSYDFDGKLSKMTDAAGQEYTYQYQGEQLVSVTKPGGLKVVYHYNEPSYSTATPAGNFLTGISREISPGNLVRYAIYKFAGGDPISTEHAGGVERYSFNYQNNTVTDPLDTVRNHYFDSILGRKIEYMMQQPGGKGVTFANNFKAFDINGNIDYNFNFNLNKTCYKYDLTRNLETVRVEGMAQYDSCPTAIANTVLAAPFRKISTQWHASFRLPVEKAEPKLRTTLGYDAAGNLLTKTLQATSDLTGALGFGAAPVGTSRTWKYTYNEVGQMLTATGPRTDVVAKDSYEYDAQGNLRKITNAAGQITTLSNYDAHGHVGRIEDPNGLATTLEYTPRGWLSSRNVSGLGVYETSLFEYDGVGQLFKATMPDASSVTYTYDDAGRLTDVTDNVGNTMHYTLDNMGNRLKEEVRDPSGVLARLTAKIYNSLNRLQQVTGAAQ